MGIVNHNGNYDSYHFMGTYILCHYRYSYSFNNCDIESIDAILYRLPRFILG